jgi:hypothetical protein
MANFNSADRQQIHDGAIVADPKNSIRVVPGGGLSPGWIGVDGFHMILLNPIALRGR